MWKLRISVVGWVQGLISLYKLTFINDIIRIRKNFISRAGEFMTKNKINWTRLYVL
jgi:hypothetical protein